VLALTEGLPQDERRVADLELREGLDRSDVLGEDPRPTLPKTDAGAADAT
jgi:hypothetical protein